MPTYEYVCTNDDTHRVEVFQRIDDPPLETCEVCGGALRKVFHPVGVVLKGSGFYKTDSRSSGKAGGSKESGSKGGGSSTEKDAGKDAGKDAKPATSAKDTPAKGTEGKGSS